MYKKLWIPVLAAALLVSATSTAFAASGTKGLRYPSLTPDGKQVVFCYRGDVWISALDGKSPARRLTLHEEQDTLTRVSPDGSLIAFSSKRSGGYDIFTVPVVGGVPKQITYHSGFEGVCDWSPDGKRILFFSQREIDPGGSQDLYEVGIDGGTPRRITFTGGREANYSADGEQIVYAGGPGDIYWDNYTGSANFDLYVIDAKGGVPRRLTHTDGNERYPFFSKDGKTIYFVAEEEGVANFYSMPAAGGDRVQVTKYKKVDVHRPDQAWDFQRVVFEQVGQLYYTTFEKPAEKPTPIPITIQSDIRNSGIERRTITGGGEQVDVSPGGDRVAFTLRGDIWTMPAGGGNGTRITEGPANEQWPRFSPSGKEIAYSSNAGGDSELFLHDLATKRTRQLTNNTSDDFFHNWSPDGKSLVFSSERSGNRDIWTLNLETGYSTQLTRHPGADDDPCYSPDGSLIAFDSDRAGSQAIFVMDTNGKNVRRVSQATGFIQVPCFSPDGRMIVYEMFEPTTGGSGGLYVMGSNGGPSVRISNDGATARWSPKGDYIYFHADRGPHGNGIFRLKAPESVETGQLVPFIGTVEVDTRKELENLFDEAWTALRDGFYDPKMHGVDWNAMKGKYRSMAITVENKDEFQNVVRQMLAELGASHLGIWGGQRLGHSVAPTVKQNGYMGLEFDYTPAEGGGRKVSRIVAGSPAEKAGMRIGDVVTWIGRVRLTAKTNLDKATAGLAGQETLVAYRPLSSNGLGTERRTRVKMITLQEMWNLKYTAWEAKCERTVEETASNKSGKVGYVHLRMMDPENLVKFQQVVQQWNSDKKIRGMILDVRHNGGGNIHNQLIAILTMKPLARVEVRNGMKAVQPGIYWDKPVIVLINERSFSDAEVFPFMFKAAGLGKVIGVPTAGGVIGTNDITLSDGSTFRVPRTGFWGMDGTPLEGLGVKPDILVEETTESRLKGEDPQLDRAIQEILADCDKREKEIADRKKAAAAAKPVKPVKPLEPLKPIKPLQPLKPLKPIKPLQPLKPVAPVKPVEQPGAVDEQVFLADVQAGEWVRYRVIDPEDRTALVFRAQVAKVDGDMVVFANEVEKGGALTMPFPETLPRGTRAIDLLAEFGKVLSHAWVDGEIDGKPARLFKAKVEWADGTAIDFTFSNTVLCYGLYRVEMNKVAIVTAIEWGVAAIPEEPRPEAPKPEAPKPEAPKPEEPKPAEVEAPPHPLANAEVGEWVLVTRPGPGGREIQLRITVKEVTDDEVVLGQLAMFEGREMPGPDIRRPKKEKLSPPDNFELSGFSKAEITVGEHTFNCIVMTATDPQGSEWKWYVAPEVPVSGYVRVEKDGETAMELLEWGTE